MIDTASQISTGLSMGAMFILGIFFMAIHLEQKFKKGNGTFKTKKYVWTRTRRTDI